MEKSKSGAAKLGHTLRHKVGGSSLASLTPRSHPSPLTSPPHPTLVLQVAPAVKHGVKKLLHRVFTGVPRLVSTVGVSTVHWPVRYSPPSPALPLVTNPPQISQETHHAAKVFQGDASISLKT